MKHWIAVFIGFTQLVIAFCILPHQPGWSVVMAAMAVVSVALWLSCNDTLHRGTESTPLRRVVPVSPAAPTTSSNVVGEAFDILVALGCKKGESKRLLASVANRHFKDAQSIIEAVYHKS